VTFQDWVGNYRRFGRCHRHSEGLKFVTSAVELEASKMKAPGLSETSETTYPITQCHPTGILSLVKTLFSEVSLSNTTTGQGTEWGWGVHRWSGVKWSEVTWFMWSDSVLKWSSWEQNTMYIMVTLYWGYLIVLWLFHLVCILCCGCLNWFCDVWVCVCVGGFVMCGFCNVWVL